MFDVVGVDGDGPVDVAGALRLQVTLHQGDHVVLVHLLPPPIRQPLWLLCAIMMRDATLMSRGIRMTVPLTTPGRVNQKTRTRTALLHAAMELVGEGRPPSIPEAAERALISVATAYRYFPSAEELWFEASAATLEFDPPYARPTSASSPVATTQWPGSKHGSARPASRWSTTKPPSAASPRSPRAMVQPGRRPRRATRPDPPRPPQRLHRHRRRAATRTAHRDDVDRIAHALGVVVGTDAMLALTDGVGLEGDDAKQAMLDAARWLLTGALAELDPANRQRH